MIYLDFIKNKDYNYTNITSGIDKANLISIPPTKNSTNLNHFSIYTGYSKLDLEIFQNNLWLKIQNWIKLNFPDFSKESIKFCTFHLASHFSQNFLSSYNIISNLIKNHNCEYTIICSTEMLEINSDWCSSLISLLATVEVFDSANIKYYLLEASPGIASSLISNGSLKYSPSILESRRQEDCHIIFKEKLIKADYISYQLTNRSNPYISLKENINIIPKSNIINDNLIGSYNQFPINSNPFPHYKSWLDHKITTNIFSNAIECNFFDSFGKYLFPKLNDSYLYLNKFLNSNNKKILALEEIVDLEALPIISIFNEHRNYITINQHSSNPIPEPLISSNKKYLASKVFVNNNHSLSRYKDNIPDVQVEMNPLLKNLPDLHHEFTYKRTITIIENDFFRDFGVYLDIKKTYSEIKLFIQTLIDLECEFDILWRQRTSEFSPLFNALSEEFNTINFQFNTSFTLDEIANTSNISIGFGSNSSLAAQLIKKGVINYFGSSSYSDFEYVPNVSQFHDFIGPEATALHINQSIKNIENSYKEMIVKQYYIIRSI